METATQRKPRRSENETKLAVLEFIMEALVAGDPIKLYDLRIGHFIKKIGIARSGYNRHLQALMASGCLAMQDKVVKVDKIYVLDEKKLTSLKEDLEQKNKHPEQVRAVEELINRYAQRTVANEG